MEGIISLLKIFFANNMVALIKVWEFHWNVKGPSFGSYHADFKELYETQIERVDSIAERLRALGAMPPKTLQQVIELKTMREVDPSITASEMWGETNFTWKSLLDEAKEILSKIPSGTDPGTENFLQGLVEDIEKELWMIRMRIS